MTDIQQKPALAGFIGTILVWILIFLFFYFSAALFAPKKFKTIKIRLDAPSKSEAPAKKEAAQTQPSPAQSQPSSQASSPVQSQAAPPPPAPPAKSEVKKTEPPSKASSAKSQPKKTQTKKAEAPVKKSSSTAKTAPVKKEQPKMVEQTLQKSIDELMAEQQQKKTTKKDFDWSQFDDVEGTSSSNTSPQINKAALVNQNTFSGSAASSSNSTSSAASASSSNRKSSAGQAASAATSAALKGALSAKPYSASTGDVSSSVTAVTGSSADGKVALQMTDGSPRILLEPSEPAIKLSQEAAAMIDSTKRLTVSFTVSASGNVSITSVKIHPDILPSLVKSEISEQISKWRFASAHNEGRASFDYTIKKN
ncbi:MAG: hypothetical protein K5873_05590 [Treponema sp.]|nr:hypothetical protein [Treponema sp.]